MIDEFENRGLSLLDEHLCRTHVHDFIGEPQFEYHLKVSPAPWITVIARPFGAVEITCPQEQRFAIWGATGAVYRMAESGFVEDDPMLQP